MKSTVLSSLLSLFFFFLLTDLVAQPFNNEYRNNSSQIARAESTAAQPLAIHFTRYNGDGSPGNQAQIRMYYTTAPSQPPVLTQIYYAGQPLYNNFTPVTADISKYAATGYITFCLSESIIPPAIKLTLTYNTGSKNQLPVEITGTD